jgi:hypothetical protein
MQLISRIQLLSDLLKDAGITVPAEPALEKISPLKWSNKINVVSGSKLINKTETRKNKSIIYLILNFYVLFNILFFYSAKRGEKKKEKNITSLKVNLKKKAVSVKRNEKQPVHNKCFPDKPKCTIEDQENHDSISPSEKSENENKSASFNKELVINNTSIPISPSKIDISKLLNLNIFIHCV